MKNGPVYMLAFGALLERARGKMSLGKAAATLHRESAALEGFSSSQLLKYEAGRVQRPDPVAIFHLCRLYGLDLIQVIAVLDEERERAAVAKINPRPRKRRASRKRQE